MSDELMRLRRLQETVDRILTADILMHRRLAQLASSRNEQSRHRNKHNALSDALAKIHRELRWDHDDDAET